MHTFKTYLVGGSVRDNLMPMGTAKQTNPRNRDYVVVCSSFKDMKHFLEQQGLQPIGDSKITAPTMAVIIEKPWDSTVGCLIDQS